LNINNPIRLDSRKGHNNLADAMESYPLTQGQVSEILRKHPRMFDPEVSPLGDYFDSYWEDGAQDWMIDDLAGQYTGSRIDFIEGDLFNYDGNESGVFRKALKDATGYDGVEYLHDGKKHMVAFEPNQIRSINAAFDPANKDSGNLLGFNSANKKPSKNPLDYINTRANGYGTIEQSPQTWADAFEDGVRNTYTALGASRGTANRHSKAFRDLVEWTPYQSVMDIADYSQGNGTALDAGIGAIDFVPGVGQVGGIAKNIFAGAKAAERLGKLDKMREAEKLLDDGLDEREVWNKTGFFRGDDGLMRFEIDDSGAETYRTASQKLSKNQNDQMNYPSYFQKRLDTIRSNFQSGRASREGAEKAIAELKEYGNELETDEVRLSGLKSGLKDYTYQAFPSDEVISVPELKDAYVNMPLVKGDDSMPARMGGIFHSDIPSKLVEIQNKNTPQEQRSTLMHELQHFAQDIEGFSKGSNLDIARDRLSSLKGRYDSFTGSLEEFLANNPKPKLEYTTGMGFDELKKAASDYQSRLAEWE